MSARSRLAHDAHRPQYHFLPPANWMNDPNGWFYWQGKYHLFYQYNPYAAVHSNIHWGHAISSDVVHWQDLPIALAPTPGGVDKDGCWSGYITDCDGVPTAFYTGAYPESQCMATSSDADLSHWQKYEGNPVIAQPPPGMDVTGFRDPLVFREGDSWFMTLGSGIKDAGGTVLLYRSDDLHNWQYMHPLFSGRLEETGDMWECPVMFPVGDKHVLLVSVDIRVVYYWVGTYRDHRFVPETHGRLDLGRYFYAPQVIIDGQGRALLIGWVQEGRHQEAVSAAGWAGVQTIPRILSLSGDSRLLSQPVPELQMLRGEHHRFEDVRLDAQSENLLVDGSGSSLEILAELEVGQVDAVGFTVLCSPDGAEQTRIVYKPGEQLLSIEREQSSQSSLSHIDTQQGVVPCDGRLRLHIFVDRSIIEVYAQDGITLTERVYPTRADSTGMGLWVRGVGHVEVKSLEIWQMHSIWSER